MKSAIWRASAVLACCVGLGVALPNMAKAGAVPEGLWLTDDRSVIVVTGACDARNETLCGLIVGIEAPELNVYAKQLCGLPLIWDMRPGQTAGVWTGGKLLDPESEKVMPAQLEVIPQALKIHIKNVADLRWARTQAHPKGCD